MKTSATWNAGNRGARSWVECGEGSRLVEYGSPAAQVIVICDTVVRDLCGGAPRLAVGSEAARWSELPQRPWGTTSREKRPLLRRGNRGQGGPTEVRGVPRLGWPTSGEWRGPLTAENGRGRSAAGDDVAPPSGSPSIVASDEVLTLPNKPKERFGREVLWPRGESSKTAAARSAVVGRPLIGRPLGSRSRSQH